MDAKKLEALYNEYKKIKGYDDGGKVQPESDFDRALRSIKESFNPPKEQPKEETLDEKYARIRKENTERASGTRPSLQSMDPDAKSYADGGEVEDDPMAGNVSPEQYQANLEALKKKYAAQQVQGDDQIITADKGSDESDADRTVDDKLIEDPYADEELAAKIKEEKPSPAKPDDSEEESDTEDDKSKDEEKAAPKAPAEDLSEDEKALQEPKEGEDAESKDAEDTPLSRMMSRLKPQKMTVDFGQSQGNLAQELKDAQAKRDQLLQGDQIQKNFNLIGAGINKARPLPPGYFDSSKLAENAVKKIEEKIALQKHDPNSQISQGMRNFVEQKYGMKIGGNPSAADIEGISKPLYNEAVAELKGATQMALAQKKYEQKVGTPAAQEGKGEIQTKAEATGGQARETEASKQKGRLELAQLKGTIAGQMFDLKKTEKTKGASVDFYKDWVHQTGRGQPLGIAARTSIFADKLPALVNQYENLNEVPDTLVTDANLAFANLISQGVPPANLQALLNKNNLPREPGKIWTWITADPQGANQKEMLQLLIDSSHKQKQLADAQMKDAAMPLLKSYEFKGMPAEQRAEILKRFNSSEDEYKKWAGGSQFAKEASAPPSKDQSGKQVVKKGYNAKTNQTQFIYDDGTKEIKDGKL